MSNIKLDGCHLRIRDLMYDSELEGQEMNWKLMEDLRTYCVWAHPFVNRSSDDDDDLGED